MTSRIPPICMFCARFNGMKKPGITCEAYPDGIPTEIFHTEVDHHHPYKGDQGLQYTPRTDLPNAAQTADWLVYIVFERTPGEPIETPEKVHARKQRAEAEVEGGGAP